MISLKPYLIRAVYDWIVDNNFTPHILVSSEHNEGYLPQGFIEDGKIVLNLRPLAVEALSLGDETIEFNAKFGGKPEHIIASVNAIAAIYAKENGKGLVFDPEPLNEKQNQPPEKQSAGKPTLKVVK